MECNYFVGSLCRYAGYLAVTGFGCPSDLTSNRIESNRFVSKPGLASNNYFYQSHRGPRGSAYTSRSSNDRSGPDRSTDGEIKQAAWSLFVERQSALLCTSTKVMRRSASARADNELVAIFEVSAEITSRCLLALESCGIYNILERLIPYRNFRWTFINYTTTRVWCARSFLFKIIVAW